MSISHDLEIRPWGAHEAIFDHYYYRGFGLASANGVTGRRILPPVPGKRLNVSLDCEVVDFGGQSDLVETTSGRIRRLRFVDRGKDFGDRGQHLLEVWHLDLDAKNRPPKLALSTWTHLFTPIKPNKSVSWRVRRKPLALIRPPPDLDRDGVPDLVWAFDTGTLSVSGKEGKLLGWSRATPNLPPAIPQDQRQDVIVPFETRFESAGIKLIEGKSGVMRWEQRLWQRQMLEMKHFQNLGHFDAAGDPFYPVHSFIFGPDLDGDGYREVFVASVIWEGPQSDFYSVYVDALSGQDGHKLWWWRRPIVLDDLDDLEDWRDPEFIRPLSWWQKGADGWPQLIVSVDSRVIHQLANPLEIGVRDRMTYFLSAATGRVTRVLADVSEVRVADLNGDGTLDLLYQYQPPGGELPELYAILGAESKAPNPAAPRLTPLDKDPRWARPLPFPGASDRDAALNSSIMFQMFTKWVGLISMLLLAALPFIVKKWPVRDRRLLYIGWITLSLAFFATFPILSLFPSAWTEQFYIVHAASCSISGLGIFVFFFTPALPFLMLVWLIRDRWKFVWWLELSLVMTALIAVGFLVHDAPLKDSEQYYTLDGWYFYLLMGAHAAALLLLAGTILRVVGRISRACLNAVRQHGLP